MYDEIKKISDEIEEENSAKQSVNDSWPEETVQNILDYIEEQGIYIRE